MSDASNEQLPWGWAFCKLDDVADLVRGIAFPKEAKGRRTDTGVVACLRTKNLQSRVEWDDLWWIPEQYVRRPDQIVHARDILISVSNSYDLVGKVAMVGELPVRATLGAFIAVIRASGSMDARFLYYLLASPPVQGAIRSVASTTTNISNVNTTKVKALQLCLAPVKEQERLADTLDELFPDLEAAVAALERVLGRLKLYRASVLKAAVEGVLTADWRAQHPHTEPATELLKRILVERRHWWEEAQRAKFKAKGQELPKNGRAKYKEPVAPDTANLPQIPEGWCWLSLDQSLWQLRSGTAETSGREPTDYPVLKSSAVRHGAIDFEDLNYLQASQSLRSENFLQRGDFLITRLSGSVNYVGCSAVVRDTASEGIQYPDRVFCGKLVAGIDGTYLSYCFEHSGVRKALEEAAKSTAGHQRISMSDLFPLRLPLPPLAEQEAIIETVEDQLSVLDHLETDLDAKLKSAQALRQSILCHAFTGRLVPQDPNDEPASELLKRIAAEREARAGKAAAAKRATKKTRGPSAGRRNPSKKNKTKDE